MLLEGKVAIVSGAGPGLGRAICTKFAGHGARLVIGDIDPQSVAASVAAVHELGGEAIGQVTDITDRASCDALVRTALERFGTLDILVNDAYDGGDFACFEDADLAHWRTTSDVNVFGTLGLTQAALHALKACGAARVVMICTHGVDLIQPSFGAYTSSKAALAHMTKLLAAELGGAGIRVNAVFPGPIWGPNLQAYLDSQAEAQGAEKQTVYGQWAAKNALNMLVGPDDIADSVVFLSSDMARPITGQALYVNAGESFH